MAERDEHRPEPACGADGSGAERSGAEGSAAEGSAVEGSTVENSAVPGGEPVGEGPLGPEAADEPPVAGTPGAGAPGTATPVAERPAAERDAPAAAAPGPDEPGFDEEAAWRAIVAGYGQEPPDPPGIRPFRPVEDLALPEPGPGDTGGQDGGGAARTPDAPRQTGRPGKGGTPAMSGADDEDSEPGGTSTGGGPARPLGGSVVFAPGVGPRDHRPATPSDDDFDEDDEDEGHFVPPEPPELPDADVTAKFAWLAVLGGPLLMLLAVLLGWQMTWWLTTLGLGGFVGGFVTLVLRMNPGDEEDDDPGNGAVV